MSFFSDILQKLKKPVDALKDFLTPQRANLYSRKRKAVSRAKSRNETTII